MRKLVFTLLVILSFCNLALAQSTIEPRLQEILNQKGDEMISVNIILKSQMNLNNLKTRANDLLDKETKRNVMVDELKTFIEKEQQEILSILTAEQRGSKVRNVSCHWLANYINCETTADVIYHISQHPDVYIIGYDEEKVLISNNYSERAGSLESITENITKVNGDDVWAMGYTGDGVVVAVIDSGVNYNHVDLKDHLWDGGSEFPNHGYNTYDDNKDPMDKFGHGTHCAGTVCGDGTSGTKTGIAPNATLMCIKSVSDEGTGTANNINSGMEWAIEHNADVLSMSLGVPMPMPSEKVMLRRSCVTALELGIIASVAAGNYGDYISMIVKPIPDNIISPGGCPPPWLSPDQEANAGELSCVVAVGSVDYTDTPAATSSEGPVTWQDLEPFNDYPYNPGIGLIRPDICAPGVDITSLAYSSNEGHTIMSGTSMATPCVAGIMCLMLEKDPSLTPADICRILETTSVKLSETKSNKTGTGRVDALAAINAVGYNNFNLVSCDIIEKTGNNNSNINPGESLSFNITFKNNSEESFSNVKAILRNKNEFVTITDSVAQISDIKANENVSLENAFSITLDENISFKTLVASDIHFFNENNEEISSIRIPIYTSGSELLFSSFIIKNDNNGNGRLEAGETADLGIILNNVGNEIAVGLKGILSTTSDELTINQREAEFNSIGGNASETAFFNVTLSETASENVKLPLDIKVTDASKREYIFSGKYKNACEVIFELSCSGGKGWQGANLIVSYSDGTPEEALSILDGKTRTIKRKISNNVEVSLTWYKGSYDLGNNFVIKYDNDNIIYYNGGSLNNGFLYSWINNCSCQNNTIETCEPVGTLTADVNKNNVILTWTAPADEIIKYEIYRDTKLIGETDGLSFVDSEIEHNRAFSYTYSIRPVYESCNGSFKSILAQWGVDINEYSHNANVNIYPNPANDKIHIVTDVEIEEVVVYDVYGRHQVTETPSHQDNLTIDVANLKSGIYFIKINTNEGNIVKRIIKN